MTAHLAELLSRAAAEVPDRVALVEAATGRRVTWAELDAEVDRVAPRAAGAGPGRRLPGGGRAGQPRRVRDGLPRRAAGGAGRRARSTRARPPASWSGCSPTAAPGSWSPTPPRSPRCARRWPASRTRWSAPTRSCAAPPPCPGSSSSGRRRCRARRRTTTCCAATGAGRPAVASRPRAAGGAALHQRHVGTPPRRDAQPPSAAGQHRAGGAGRAADAHRRRRGARGAAAVPRLRPQRRAGPGAAPAGPAGAGRRLRHGGLARGHRGRGGHGAAGGAAGLRLLAGRPRPARAAERGAAGAVRVGAALPASWSTASPQRTGIDGAPGLRPDRGGPGGHLDAVPAARAPSRARSGAALPGVEIRLVDEAGHAPEGGDAGEIWVRGANLFSGYWPDGADGPDAGGWYATGDVGFLDPDGDLFLVDRLKELVIVSGLQRLPASRSRRCVTELDGVAEAAVIGTPARAHRRGGGRLRAARLPGRRAPTTTELAPAGARALRRPAGPVQAAHRGARGRASCRTPSPARWPRAGCGRTGAGATLGLLE